jgi:HK97 family phage major capsid protein
MSADDFRHLDFIVTRADADSGTLHMVAATGSKIDRGMFDETIDPAGMDLSRVAGGVVSLLLDHDPVKRAGKVVSAQWIGRELHAVAKINANQHGKELRAELADGFRPPISVGYSIKAERNVGTSDRPHYQVDKSALLEISAVSVPADPAAVSRGDTVTRTTPPLSTRATTMEDTTETPPRAAERTDDRASEVAEIYELARLHNRLGDVRGWLQRGLTRDQVGSEILSRQRAAHVPISSPSGFEDAITPRDQRTYSLARALFPKEHGDNGYEREVSQELGRQINYRGSGVLMPMRTRTTLTSTGAGTGAELNHTFYGSFQDRLRVRTMLGKLGANMGLAMDPGTTTFPNLATSASVSWVGENPGSAVTATNPTFSGVTSTMHTLAGQVPYTVQSLRQSTPMVDQLISSDMSQVVATEIDRVGFAGSGSGNEPTGLLNVSGTNVVSLGTNGGAMTRAKILEMIQDVDLANADPDASKFLFTAEARTAMKQIALQSGYPVYLWPQTSNQIESYDAYTSNNLPKTLTKGSGTALHPGFFGDFSEVSVGMWQGVEFITDIYTGAGKGLIYLTVHAFCDVIIRRPQAFSVVKDLIAS